MCIRHKTKTWTWCGGLAILEPAPPRGSRVSTPLCWAFTLVLTYHFSRTLTHGAWPERQETLWAWPSPDGLDESGQAKESVGWAQQTPLGPPKQKNKIGVVTVDIFGGT